VGVCGGELIASVAAVTVRRARRSKFVEFKWASPVCDQWR
jgi:hypothetical protein